ncbi:MAG TPA: VOC family protein, partial [Candidatus Eremiobacteraceae bacterium]|nr:VOC family protein [Candidatus Eremiobacteraceae bacterium]
MKDFRCIMVGYASLSHLTFFEGGTMVVASRFGINGIDTTGYLVKDVARAEKFYTDLLGFSPTLRFLPVGVEWTFPSGETF